MQFQKKIQKKRNLFSGSIEAAATIPSAELDTTRTRLRSAYNTNAPGVAKFMRHGIPQICTWLVHNTVSLPLRAYFARAYFAWVVFEKIYPAGVCRHGDYVGSH
jgi:hypothetical protein